MDRGCGVVASTVSIMDRLAGIRSLKIRLVTSSYVGDTSFAFLELMVPPNKAEFLPFGRLMLGAGVEVFFERADPNSDDLGAALGIDSVEGAVEVKSAQTSSTFVTVTGLIVSVGVEVAGAGAGVEAVKMADL